MKLIKRAKQEPKGSVTGRLNKTDVTFYVYGKPVSLAKLRRISLFTFWLTTTLYVIAISTLFSYFIWWLTSS